MRDKPRYIRDKDGKKHLRTSPEGQRLEANEERRSSQPKAKTKPKAKR